MIADELDMFPLAYVRSTLFPIITGQEKTGFIGMTTRNQNANKSWIDGFSSFQDENGKKIVDCLNVERVCERCLALGGESALNCNHKKINLVMRSSKKENLFVKYMIESGGVDDVKREILGLKTASKNLAFDKKYIDDMINSHYNWIPDIYVPWSKNNRRQGFDNIIISVDPNGGGPNEAALCIMGHECSKDLYVVSFLSMIFINIASL